MFRSAFLSALAACVALTGSVSAQQFSSPGTPAKTDPSPTATPAGTAPAPAAKPADNPDNHRVGNGGTGFELPLKLYDEKADSGKDVARACERAKRDNRRVLVMWGENRCEFCAYLNQLLNTDPRIKQVIESEYVWVKVDIGKFDRNLELANHFDVPITKQGYGAPALLVIEPNGPQSIANIGGNDMVAKQMTTARVFDEGVVLNFLDKNKPQPKVAISLALDAQLKAKRDGKRALLYFNVYGSDACKAFDRAASEPAAAATLDKAFVVRKIDVERNIAGYELLRKLKDSKTATPPWMIVLDGDGAPVSEAGKGLEFDPEEAPAAAAWLVGASAGKLDTADQESLAKALKPEPAPVEEAKK